MAALKRCEVLPHPVVNRAVQLRLEGNAFAHNCVDPSCDVTQLLDHTRQFVAVRPDELDGV
jgi:hypothetical protein